MLAIGVVHMPRIVPKHLTSISSLFAFGEPIGAVTILLYRCSLNQRPIRLEVMKSDGVAFALPKHFLLPLPCAFPEQVRRARHAIIVFFSERCRCFLCTNQQRKRRERWEKTLHLLGEYM